MIEPNIYCKVSGMTMRCIADFQKEKGRRPVVVEIGCADGQGTMRYAGFCELVICIDPMVADRPDIDSRNESDVFEVHQEKLANFKRRTDEFPVKLVIGPSLWPSTMEKFKVELGERKVDILVIDGCHHPFEAVWGDFESYYPFVEKSGFVIFDDLYEDCILKSMEKAILDKGMVLHDRWSIRNESMLQDVAALRKTEE